MAVKPSEITEAHKKGNTIRRFHAEGQLSHSLYPPHDDGKMEGRRVREKHQKINGEVEKSG